jgi:hypothetical protein
MNKVDQLVKQAMLNYPTLYKNRWQVLAYVLLSTGGDYEWRDGELTNFWGTKDKPNVTREQFIADSHSEIEKLENGLRYDNLDLYASDDQYFQSNQGYSVAYTVFDLANRGGLSGQRTRLENLPVEKCDPEWRKACDKFLSELISRARGHNLNTLAEELVALQTKLCPYTEEEMEQRRDKARRIVAQILADEND